MPQAARTELERIRRRWSELPIAQADRRMPLLRGVLADLAPRSHPRPMANPPPPQALRGAEQVGAPPSVEGVPDLGPGVVVDQLAVLVWDAYAAGRGGGIPELLTGLRRDLG